MKLYLKIKRAIRFLFYKHLPVEDQIKVIHDIGKSISHFSWIFRIFSELKIVNNNKSRLYLDHEINGLTELEKYSVNDDIIQYYKKELLQNKHFILDKTDY